MNTFLALLRLLTSTADLGSAVLETSTDTYLTRQEANIHALAASMAATKEVPAEVLLSMAWVESRYSPKAVSRIENGSRVTGIPKWRTPPKGSRSFFCGVTQVSAGDSWKRCLDARDIFASYRETVKELRQWMSPRICGYNLRCALTGYSGGFAAIKSGTNNYAPFVLKRARLIGSSVHRREARL